MYLYISHILILRALNKATLQLVWDVLEFRAVTNCFFISQTSVVPRQGGLVLPGKFLPTSCGINRSPQLTRFHLQQAQLQENGKYMGKGIETHSFEAVPTEVLRSAGWKKKKKDKTARISNRY